MSEQLELLRDIKNLLIDRFKQDSEWIDEMRRHYEESDKRQKQEHREAIARWDSQREQEAQIMQRNQEWHDENAAFLEQYTQALAQAHVRELHKLIGGMIAEEPQP